MRPDMAKVIVERPRTGAGHGRRPARPRRHDDEAPARETAAERARGRSKHLNENLAPLRRFLGSCVGRPWAAVLAEVCAQVRLDSTVQRHVREHLERDLVVTRVELVGGVPVHAAGGWRAGQPLRRDALYVCPRTGLLRRPRPVRAQRLAPTVEQVVPVGGGGGGSRTFELVDGEWFEVTWARLGGGPRFDVLARAWRRPGEGGDGPCTRVAVAKRQVGGKALAALRRAAAGERVPGLRAVADRFDASGGVTYVREHGSWRRAAGAGRELGWPDRDERRALVAAERALAGGG